MASGLNQVSSVPQAEFKLDAAMRRLDQENDRLAKILGQIEDVSRRLFGSSNLDQCAQAPQPQPVPNGVLDHLHDLISRTSQLTGHLQAEVLRLTEV